MDTGSVGEKDLPRYSYNRHRLTAVKHDIYNPRIPTFRHMDRDTGMHFLPDEHCRTSTTLGPEDFKRSTSSVFQPGKIPLHHLPITAQGRELLKYGPNLEMPETNDLQQERLKWREDIVRCPEKFSIIMQENSKSNQKPTFVGYAARYLRPEITGSWQYTLQQTPSFDQYGRKPLAPNIFARYRDNHPNYNRDASSQVWN